MLHNFISDKDINEILLEKNSLALLRFTENMVLSDELEKTIPSLKIKHISEREDKLNYEVWKADGEEFQHSQFGSIFSRSSENLQFCSISAPLLANEDAEEVAYKLYDELLKFIAQSQHKQIIRFWNYLPHINYGAGDNENYKRFCSGRLRAFAQNNIDENQFPAASAVGHFKEGITIYAFSCSQLVNHFANPRQIDAFKYPRQYGPSSPSFARASTVQIKQNELCFISGTASILGHKTVHEGNLELQLETIKENILYLLKTTNFKANQIQTLRVYLRHKKDYEACKKIVEQHYPNASAIYTHADICRADLLVEIECFCVSS